MEKHKSRRSVKNTNGLNYQFDCQMYPLNLSFIKVCVRIPNKYISQNLKGD